MRYKVIESGTAYRLTILVNAAIAEGWVPLGGHFIEPQLEGRSYNRFSQAMTHPDLPPADPLPAPEAGDTTSEPLFPVRDETDGGYGAPKTDDRW